MWQSSLVSELLAFAYSDVFSVSPVMIQRFLHVPDVHQSLIPSHNRLCVLEVPANLAVSGCLCWDPACPRFSPPPWHHSQVAGVMLKVRGVKVSRSLSPLSTKSRYLYDDQVLPMLQSQSRIMSLMGKPLADLHGDTKLASILYFPTVILFYSPPLCGCKSHLYRDIVHRWAGKVHYLDTSLCCIKFSRVEGFIKYYLLWWNCTALRYEFLFLSFL